MFRDVLRVYDSDCILYDTSLEETRVDAGTGDYTSSVPRPVKFEFNWTLWLAVLTVWALIFVFTRQSVISMRWLFYLSWPLRIAFLFVMVLFGMQLKNGDIGVTEYLFGTLAPTKKYAWEKLEKDTSNNLWEALQHSEIWLDAASQSLYSVGVSYWTSYGSYCRIDKPVVGDAVHILAFDTLCSVFAGLFIFTVVGHLRAEELPFDARGNEGVFIGVPYSFAISTDNPPLWSCLFFATWFLFGLSSSFGNA